MKELIIDTTSSTLVIVVLDNDKRYENILNTNNNQAEIVMDEIKKLLSKASMTLKDIERCYVGVGPGSYTGVRIGITMAKTLKAINKEIIVKAFNSLLLYIGGNDGVCFRDAKSGKLYALKAKKMHIIEQALINEADREFYKGKEQEFDEFEIESFIENRELITNNSLTANYLKDANAHKLC